MAGHPGEPRGVAALLRELAHGSSDLFRNEAKLARMELADIAGSTARGAVQVALGGVLLLLGVLALVVGIVLVAGDQWLPADFYWMAALLVALVAGAIAAWMARRGLTLLSPTNLAPDQTVATLKEDREWLKQRLTSGAT